MVDVLVPNKSNEAKSKLSHKKYKENKLSFFDSISIDNIISNAWDEIGLPAGTHTDRLNEEFRDISIRYALGIEGSESDFQKKAIAYRFLSSIPLVKKEYKPSDLLPLLRPLDSIHNKEINQNIRTSALLDVSITCMERAQNPWELPYVNYVIAVHYCMRKHIVRRRYSEFLRLHQALQNKVPVLPEFPEKNWMNKLPMSGDRAKALALYLTRLITLLSHRGVFSVDIMAFLEIDHSSIRAEEEGLAAQRLNASSMSRMLYVISSEWLGKWKQFVTESGAPPGPIMNQNLLLDNGTPREDVSVAKDYRFINKEVWQYLMMVYGGGPEICRENRNIYGVRAFDRKSAAICIQKIARQFIAKLTAKKRKLYLASQNAHAEKLREAKEEYDAAEKAMEKIRWVIRSKEDTIVEGAARKIQKVIRKRYKEKRVQSLQQDVHSIDKDIHVNQKKVSKYRDDLTVTEIETIEDDDHRLAQLIQCLMRGVQLRKKGSQFSKLHSYVFTLSEDGSKISWVSKKKEKSIVLADVVSLNMGSLDSPRKKRRSWGVSDDDEELMLTFQLPQKKMILFTANQAERKVLFFGLKILIEEGKKRIQSGAYMDSYGILRKKTPHAKKVIRDVDNLLLVKEDEII